MSEKGGEGDREGYGGLHDVEVGGRVEVPISNWNIKVQYNWKYSNKHSPVIGVVQVRPLSPLAGQDSVGSNAGDLSLLPQQRGADVEDDGVLGKPFKYLTLGNAVNSISNLTLSFMPESEL